MTERRRKMESDSDGKELSVENKLNLILYDGEVMYVHSNFRDTLYQSERDGSIVFSTTPLDASRGYDWETVPFTRLLAYRNGELIRTGTDHGHEFFNTEEKMRLLFLDYSGL